MPLLKRAVKLITFGAIALLMGAGVPVKAQQSASPISLEVRAGFGGYIQQGAWAPILVTASNSGDDVSGELRIEVNPLSGGRTIYTQSVELPRASRKLIALYPGDLSTFSNELEIVLVSGFQTLARQTIKVQFVEQRRLLIGFWSDTPASLASFGDVESTVGKAATTRLDENDFPALGEAWESLDVLAISDADTGKLTPEQRLALQQWVSQGGRLIICGGPNAQKTLAGLGDLAPILASGTESISVDALGSAVGVTLGTQSSDTIVSTGSLADGSQIMLRDGNTPLIVSKKFGTGRVDFLAADPSLEPLRSWPGLTDLWTLILSDGESRPGWGYGFGGNWEAARSAVAAVPGVSLPSILALCGFLGIYALLIGPVNYFVLLRLKRRELAWFTVPALVIIFTAVAYFTGFQIRGSQVILHRLAIVQSWPGNPDAKVDSLMGVWSPSRTRYDIQLEPGYLAMPMPRDLGGALTTFTDTTIEDGEPITLRGVQVDIGSVQPFVIEGYAPAPALTGTVEITASDDGLRVTGDILNSSQLSLESVTIIALSSAVHLGDMPAGKVAHVDHVFNTGYAQPSSASGIDPFPDTTFGPAYYEGGSSSLAYEMAGASDCYNAGTEQRRCQLINSILASVTSGDGVYLVGWTDKVPYETNVLNATSQFADTSVYIIELEATRSGNASALSTIPPGLTTWRLLGDSAGNPSQNPYNFYSSDGAPVTFRFEPLRIVPLPHITSLVIHVEGYDTSPESLPIVELWNYSTGDWDRIQVSWGDNAISSAQEYVDGRGGVIVRVQPDSGQASQAGYVSLSRLDVTLLGQ